ncbi:MAG: PorT family protein [Bacteroidales bacterium]|nr:PorT family protein [Bacteroidales bacterium]
MGYTVGLSLLYKPWERFSFETGLLFSNKGYQTKYIGMYDVMPPAPVFENRAKRNYQYYYLDIPLKVNYFVLTGSVKLFASAGLSASIFLDEREKVTFEHPKSTEIIKSDTDFSAISVAVILGAGIDYTINNRLNLRIEPVFRHAIIPLLDAPIKEYHYSIGANFGLYYTL